MIGRALTSPEDCVLLLVSPMVSSSLSAASEHLPAGLPYLRCYLLPEVISHQKLLQVFIQTDLLTQLHKPCNHRSSFKFPPQPSLSPNSKRAWVERVT